MEDDKVREIAEILHQIFCNKLHEDDMISLTVRSDITCNWYLEECIDTCWEEPSHQPWLLRATLFIRYCKDAGLNDVEINNVLADLIEICKLLLTFYDINPDLRKTIADLLTMIQ